MLFEPDTLFDHVRLGRTKPALVMISKGEKLPFNWGYYAVGKPMHDLLNKVIANGFRTDFANIVKRAHSLHKEYKKILCEHFPLDVATKITSLLV